MRILIAGCGDVGTRLGLLLVADGHEVWAIRRQAEQLPSAIRGISADLTDQANLRDLPENLDHIYYTAAADRSTEDAYRRAYVDGLRHLLAAVEDSPLPPSLRVIFVSSTSVYGQVDGEWVDEDSITEPAGFRGRLILQAETLLADSARQTATVRFAGIYGPGRTRLIDSVRTGEAVCFDDPPLYTNRIHVDDCAGVLRHLGRLETLPPRVLGVDHEPALDSEVKRWLASHLSVAEPPSADNRPGNRRRPRANKRCSNRRLLASGYRFLYRDYRVGYETLIGAQSARRPVRLRIRALEALVRRVRFGDFARRNQV